MFVGEIKKTLKNRIVWMIILAIYAANIITAIGLTRKSEIYQYAISEGKNYSEYITGHIDETDMAFYIFENDASRQEVYKQTYRDFIQNMSERGNDILLVYGSDNKYLNRNVKKTENDYSKLSDIEIKPDNCFGIVEYVRYGYGIIYVLLLAFILFEYVYFQERKNGTLSIIKCTVNGRMRLAAVKFEVYILLIAMCTLLSEISVCVLYGSLYGYGDMTRSIQSVSIFRDCIYELTVFTALALGIIIRVGISVVAGAVIFLFGMLIDNMTVSLTASLVIFTLEYITNRLLSVSGRLDGVKALNIFYVWNMDNAFGEYHNIELFGFPFDKNVIMLLLCIMIVFTALVLGSVSYSVKFQSDYKKRKLFLIGKIRFLLSKILHGRNLAFNELYKIVIQQRKWVIAAIFIALIVLSADEYIPHDTFSTALEASYHMLVSRVEGKIDDDTIAEIDNMTAEITQMKMEMNALIAEDNMMEAIQKKAEYENMERGYVRLMQQYEAMSADGDIEEKYIVDELDYINIWNSWKKDIVLTCLGLITLIIFISGLYCADEKYDTRLLLNTTMLGRKDLSFAKVMSTIVLAFIIFFISQLPLLRGYMMITDTACIQQCMSNFFEPHMKTQISLWQALCIVFILKAAVFEICGFATILISKKIKDELIVTASMTAMTVIFALILYTFKSDITLVLINYVF